MTNENVGNGGSCGSHFPAYTYLSLGGSTGKSFYLTFYFPSSLRTFCAMTDGTALLLFQFFVCQDQCILVYCIADNTRFLLTIFNEGTGNIFFQLAGMCHV